MITYLTLKSNHHNGATDRKYVEEVFDDYAVNTTSSEGITKQIITKQNAILAYEEIFKMWKIDLTEEQKKKVKDVYFNQAWKKFSEDGNLNLQDAYRF